jgi:ubiquinone/menaquinone biosynthesis C-methylase UbiE
MSWFDLPRVPEPEVMDDLSEVEAYSSAASDAYLSRIDDAFVEHAVALLRETAGRALDIGCGPGQILRKLSARLRWWRFFGVDRSLTMIRRARERGDQQPSSISFVVGDAASLPFPDACFQLVICNSVLHHVSNPAALLSEIRRVADPEAAILVRDLRRPSRLRLPFHVRWHGRYYQGLMYKLYCDSVRAADISGARLFSLGFTHLGIERRAAPCR